MAKIYQHSDLLKLKIYKKCSKDPIFFIKNFCFIETTIENDQGENTSGVFKLNPHPYQVEFIERVLLNQFNVVVKGRQLGFSTIISAYCAWLLLFKPSHKIIAISKDARSAKEIVEKVRLVVNRLPDWLKPATFLEDNVFSLKLSNRASIQSLGGGAKSGRSFSCNFLILDEAAFIPRLDKITTSTIPTLSKTKGRCVMISTPEGPSGEYYDTYTNAQLGKNKFVHFDCPWWKNPEYTKNIIADPLFPGGYRSPWAEEEFLKFGHDKNRFLQEYCCSFNVADNMYFPNESLDFIRMKTVEEPHYYHEYNFFADMPFEFKNENDLWIFRLPEFGREYLMPLDVSRGDGKDNSVIHVFDKLTGEQVLEYNGKMGTIDLAHLAIYLSEKYNNALIIPENNSVGWSTVQEMIQRDCPNLFYAPKNWDNVFKQNYIYEDYGTSRNIPGFQTTAKTRPIILSQLKEDLIANDLIIRSRRTLLELESFVWNNRKPEAKQGKKDDLVMALAIMSFVRTVFFNTMNISSEVVTYMLNGFGKGANEINLNNYQSRLMGDNRNPGNRNMQQEYKDFGWLSK